MTTPDPFGGGAKNPSLSWKGLPFGTRYVGTIAEEPGLIHGRDFKTKELDYWPADANGVRNPKMVAVVALDIGGTVYSVWAPKPSALFAAIAEAQQVAGERMKVGGTLEITYTHDEPTDGDPKRCFSVVYRPPVNSGAFATDSPAAAPAPAPAPVAATPPAAAASGGSLNAETLAAIENLKSLGLTTEAATAAALA